MPILLINNGACFFPGNLRDYNFKIKPASKSVECATSNIGNASKQLLSMDINLLFWSWQRLKPWTSFESRSKWKIRKKKTRWQQQFGNYVLLKQSWLWSHSHHGYLHISNLSSGPIASDIFFFLQQRNEGEAAFWMPLSMCFTSIYAIGS